MFRAARTLWVALAAAAAMPWLAGCTVVTVATTAVSVTASAVGVAADVAVGTAKVVGKGVGMAADAIAGGDADDASGIRIRESIRPAGQPPT
ncbi:hypothetical protein [Paracidovorax anthurii]|uniref:Lipoprotein n=1 Tax=Paracidovorax anthurii TaxID=78229 RepID=A0A328YS57_9BURK|nr:hypothetical protein [Paracidovorax anthurii]RAR76254.1 hypothetical protein AX018_105112 [Paracidovorax anthurii]WCM94277.1 hypothetical protein M5C99_05985 [Acidovorax sp. NCPPB 2350]